MVDQKSRIMDVVEGVNLATGKRVRGPNKKTPSNNVRLPAAVAQDTPGETKPKILDDEELLGTDAFLVEHQVWERQNGEAFKAYEAFKVYRELGWERSLRGVVRKADEFAVSTVQRWSHENNWAQRVDAFDIWKERREYQIRENAIVTMEKRHAQMARFMQQKIMERLQGVKPEELSLSELARWADLATKMERLSLGEPTEHTKRTNESRSISFDFMKNLSNEELAVLEDIMARTSDGNIAGKITVEPLAIEGTGHELDKTGEGEEESS